MERGSDRWTIAELAERAAAALAGDGQLRGLDARTRDMPDARTIRWYQTTGLVDRPGAARGRTALYGERHLVQLVAIKRLQAAGRSLAAIQTELAGASDRDLRRLASLPEPSQDTPSQDTGRQRGPGSALHPAVPTDHLPRASEDGPAESIGSPAEFAEHRRQRARPRNRFWSSPAAPAESVPAESVPAESVPTQPSTIATDGAPDLATTSTDSSAIVRGIRLTSGVLLLVEGNRAPDPADAEALRRVAAPLLAELASRKLLEETT